MSNLIKLDQTTEENLLQILDAHVIRIGQLDRPNDKRTLTARNYHSSLVALGEYMTENSFTLPTRSVLEQWRDDMADGLILSPKGEPYATSSINARLAAARKLLRQVAADTTDIQLKLVLESWAGVTDAKGITVQDYVEDDYGIRLTLPALEKLLNKPDTRTLIGLRDRTLLVVLAGAGLRVSEAVNLKLSDLGVTEGGIRGIRVRDSKYRKSRVSVVGAWNNWVFDAIQKYTDVLALKNEDAVLWALERVRGGGHIRAEPLSIRQAQQIVSSYQADYNGAMVAMSAHHLRRTYAKLCRQSGMEWEAIQMNLGHSSLETTQRYVGKEVDWALRVPSWSVHLK